MPAALVPVAVGLATNLISNAQAKKQEKYADSIKVNDANYADSPYAQAMLAEAQQQKNARMPGAGIAEANIDTNQANTNRSIERNATNGAQALATYQASQGNTNEAYKGLTQQEQQWHSQALQNLQNVNQTFADNTFQGQLRKQMLMIQQKQALGLAATQNRGQGTNALMNGIMAGVNTYYAGGAGTSLAGLFGNNNPGSNIYNMERTDPNIATIAASSLRSNQGGQVQPFINPGFGDTSSNLQANGNVQIPPFYWQVRR